MKQEVARIAGIGLGVAGCAVLLATADSWAEWLFVWGGVIAVLVGRGLTEGPIEPKEGP